ncbi:MAG: translation initiation factor IF-3 [Candidatus Margulisiibacteriota bacterium]
MRRSHIKHYILNSQIRAKEIRLIDADGARLGVVTLEEARRIAEQKDLDVLLISDNIEPPVCKLVDFEHFRYEQQKKDKQQKKGGKNQVTKELKLSPNISDHDYLVRLNSAKKFLTKKYKVKATLFFKGRQITHPELGKEVMMKFMNDLKELGIPESTSLNTERVLTVNINPK